MSAQPIFPPWKGAAKEWLRSQEPRAKRNGRGLLLGRGCARQGRCLCCAFDREDRMARALDCLTPRYKRVREPMLTAVFPQSEFERRLSIPPHLRFWPIRIDL